jgi:hypothetical protein
MKGLLIRVTGVLLAVCLLLGACGVDIPTKEADTPADMPGTTAQQTLSPETQAPAPSETQDGLFPAETTAPEEDPARESLWDKKISGEQVSIPEKAFSGGAERCSAIAPDGETLLMSGTVAPYLYNMQTKKTTRLVPADAATEEYLREMILTRYGVSIKATTEQMAAMQERLARMSGAELTAELCMNTGRIAPLRQYTGSFYTRENYLFFVDAGYTALMLIDCSSGRYYSVFERSITPLGVRDGKLLYFLNPSPVLKLLDLESGNVEEIEMKDPSLFPDGARLRAASFLPDGSLCAVLADMKLDPEGGENCALVIRSSDGKTESWPLGRMRYAWEPDTILAAGTDCILAFSRQAARVSAPYLIRRTAGEVLRPISGEDGLVQLLSAEEYAARYPEKGDAAVGLIPLDSLSDDETLLLQNSAAVGILLLFHPSDGQSQRLIPELDGFPMVIYFSGNHYDRFMDGGYPTEKAYYQLTFR